MSANEFNPKRWCMDLILDYEVYDEDGSCVPYFTGRITDAEGRVICQAENEERAAELVGCVKALHADYAALRNRVARLEEALRDAERVLEWAEPQPKPVLERVRRALEEK